MNEQDRQAIERLFLRLAETERQAAPKDAEADAYIKRRIEQQPGAPYMMAQTIVGQSHALEQAQQRIQELEEQAGERSATANRRGGMFGGLVGGGGTSPISGPRAGSVPAAGGRSAPIPPQQQGGGFLAGAAQTAMGVAGGVLLGNAIGSMFGGSAAQAAPPTAPAADPQTPPEQPQPAAAEPAPEPQPASDESGGGWLDSMFGGGDDLET